MGALLLALHVLCAPPTMLVVEVSSADQGDPLPSREVQQLEDAVALAYNSEALHVETRRQRLSRTPPAVYFHHQALMACADPNWPKAKVMKCVARIQFPAAPLKQPIFIRATHQLRVMRVVTTGGEELMLTLTTLGARKDADTYRKHVLAKDASPEERRSAALAMAAELFAPIRDTPLPIPLPEE